MSELWKKKLLDEQRTHVLKGVNCTVNNIKYYFQQIWSQIINEKQDDDEMDEYKSFEDKCQQAFQQANIQIKMNKTKKVIKLTPKKNFKKIIHETTDEEFIEQLNQTAALSNYLREQIAAINSSQILKMNNHIQQSADCKS
jgi:hypothetical protein